MLQERQFCSLFYAFGMKEGTKEDDMKAGESQAGTGLQDS